MAMFDGALTASLPIPYWIVEFFKTLGFALHLIPMGIWLVGLPCSLLLWTFGGVVSKRLAQRVFQQLPVVIALGINFGIIPLLFVQLAYSRLFYSTTILVAVHWLGVLPLLFLAYYSSYLCANGAKKEKKWSTAFWACLSIVGFVAIGLIFSSIWTLFERPYELETLWRSSQRVIPLPYDLSLTFGGFGAASGLATYWKDLVVFVRFACVWGVGFYAAAFWIVFDAYYVYRGPRPLTEEEEYLLLESSEVEQDEETGKPKRKKRIRLPIQENPETYPLGVTSVACCLVFLGVLVAVPALGDYLFKELNVKALAVQPNWNPRLWQGLIVGLFTFLALPLLFLILCKLKKISGRTLASGMAFCEIGLVGCFATIRQIVQRFQLVPYFDVVSTSPSDEKFSLASSSPFLAFLGVLVVTSILTLCLIRLMSSSGAPVVKKAKVPKEKKRKKESTDEEVRSINTSSGKKASVVKKSTSSPIENLTLGSRPHAGTTPPSKKSEGISAPGSGKKSIRRL